MKQPSVMKHNFAKTPTVKLDRSTFDRSHDLKTTFDAGYIVPIFVDEVVPGDTLNMRVNTFARLATPLKPILDNLFLDLFFFFVPNRLLWDNWEKFMGARIPDPDSSIDFTVPQVTIPAAGPEIGSLSDYFGWPVDVANGYTGSAFWHRAANMCWNEWFRDQNLQDSVTVDTDDGPDTLSDYVLMRRGKRHDYFTACLPWPQKQDDPVAMPLAGDAPVSADWNVTAHMRKKSDGTIIANETFTTDASGVLKSVGSGSVEVYYDPEAGGMEADLSGATGPNINELREALQLQVMLERDARGGTRYIELIKSHFGVTSPDSRVQRSEYLGGGSSPISIHPVPQTSGQATPVANDAQGNLAAFGTSSASGMGFNKGFVEHGVVLGFANVRADLTYQRGLNRMFSRSTRYDYYWPSLANLGEQAVLNKEIWLNGDSHDDEVFGYIPRYDEMRFKPSQITGKFRSTDPTTLDIWHLSQEFPTLPSLDDSFIQEEPPLDRVIAVPSEPHILFDAWFQYTCTRPMPVHSIPRLGSRL